MMHTQESGGMQGRRESGRPRIAMVSTHGYLAAAPPLGAADTGAQIVYVLELSKKLAHLGFDVDLWTRQFEDQPATEDVEPGVRILRVPCGGSDFIPKDYLHHSLTEWCHHALARVAKERLSYVFLNSHYWDAGLAGRHLCAALRIPHVHTPHSLGPWQQRRMLTDFPEGPEAFERQYNFRERNRIEEQICSQANLVIATTPEQLDWLRQYHEVPELRLAMIPPGYDDARFHPIGAARREGLRRRFGFEGKVILSLGRIARDRGYDLLIRAFAEVARREAEARLHLAIGGVELEPAEQRLLEDCRSLAKQLGLSNRVAFSGFVPDSDMADLYRAANVFVASSRYARLGMTAVEAMACGTPTVVTIHGGLFRILRFGIHGLFADPLDPMDLANAMLKPLQHPPLAERLSRRGARLARGLFTWGGIAQQVLRATEARAAGGKPTSLESKVRASEHAES